MMTSDDRACDGVPHLFEFRCRRFAVCPDTMDCFALDEECYNRARAGDYSAELRRAVEGCDRGNGETGANRTGFTKLMSTRGSRVFDADEYLAKEAYKTTPIHTADFHVTNACNLACRYCYGQEVDGYVKDGEAMDWDTAREAIDFLARRAPSNTPFTMIFFGGEPLMNYNLVRKCALYASGVFANAGKSIKYSITTNGTILNEEMIEFFTEHNFSIMISVDGTQSVHDTLRPFRGSGRPTYDLVAGNAAALIERLPGRISARATICDINKNLWETSEHLRSMGFGNVVFGLETSTNSHEFHISQSNAERSYENLCSDILDSFERGRMRLVEPFPTLMRVVLFGLDRAYPCGAGRTYVAIAPNGDLYPCHRFMGLDAQRIGDIRTGFQPKSTSRYWSLRVDDREVCSSCWAKRFCGGGCPFEHLTRTGDVQLPHADHCRTIRRIIELSIALAFECQERYPEWLQKWIAHNQSLAERAIEAQRNNRIT